MAGSGQVRGWRRGGLIAVALALSLAPLCLSAAPATPGSTPPGSSASAEPGDDVVQLKFDLVPSPSIDVFQEIGDFPVSGSHTPFGAAGLGDLYNFDLKKTPLSDFKFDPPDLTIRIPSYSSLEKRDLKVIDRQQLALQQFGSGALSFDEAYDLYHGYHHDYDDYDACEDYDDYFDYWDCEDGWIDPPDDDVDYAIRPVEVITGYVDVESYASYSIALRNDPLDQIPNFLAPYSLSQPYRPLFQSNITEHVLNEGLRYFAPPDYGTLTPPISLAPTKTSGSIPGACPRAGAVLAEINFARTDPAGYLAHWPGANGDVTSFLHRQMPVPPLTYSPLLEQAAIGYAAEQSAGGPIGHIGINGSTPRDRIQATGVFTTKAAEVISYGYPTPSGEIQQLITDAGNPGTPHRDDIYSPLLQFAGVGCGPQPKYGTVTVIDMTASIMLAPHVSPPPPPPP